MPVCSDISRIGKREAFGVRGRGVMRGGLGMLEVMGLWFVGCFDLVEVVTMTMGGRRAGRGGMARGGLVRSRSHVMGCIG